MLVFELNSIFNFEKYAFPICKLSQSKVELTNTTSMSTIVDSSSTFRDHQNMLQCRYFFLRHSKYSLVSIIVCSSFILPDTQSTLQCPQSRLLFLILKIRFSIHKDLIVSKLYIAYSRSGQDLENAVNGAAIWTSIHETGQTTEAI